MKQRKSQEMVELSTGQFDALVFFAAFGVGWFLLAGWLLLLMIRMERADRKERRAKLQVIKHKWDNVPQEAR